MCRKPVCVCVIRILKYVDLEMFQSKFRPSDLIFDFRNKLAGSICEPSQKEIEKMNTGNCSKFSSKGCYGSKSCSYLLIDKRSYDYNLFIAQMYGQATHLVLSGYQSALDFNNVNAATHFDLETVFTAQRQKQIGWLHLTAWTHKTSYHQ